MVTAFVLSLLVASLADPRGNQEEGKPALGLNAGRFGMVIPNTQKCWHS